MKRHLNPVMALACAAGMIACSSEDPPVTPAEPDPPGVESTATAQAPQKTAGFPDLPPLSGNGLTLTGVSAGAFMAQQLHLAYSGSVDGVALVATGPWGCADGSLGTAMRRCLAAADPNLDVAELLAAANVLAETGKIDPLEGLDSDRVWVFSGTLDTTIHPALGAQTLDFYRQWLDESDLQAVTDVAAAHHFPTRDQGSDCGVSEPPWLGACQFDTAGKALEFLLGPLEAPSAAPDGQLMTLPLDAGWQSGLYEEAYLYLPQSCHEGSPCRLHVVLHGCAQSAETVGTAFVEGSGYQRWAGPNRLAILYPQVTASAANPYACWDWWGYSGENFQTREGVQPAAIMRLVAQLTGTAVSQK